MADADDGRIQRQRPTRARGGPVLRGKGRLGSPGHRTGPDDLVRRGVQNPLAVYRGSRRRARRCRRPARFSRGSPKPASASRHPSGRAGITGVVELRLFGDGNIEAGLVSTKPGFFCRMWTCCSRSKTARSWAGHSICLGRTIEVFHASEQGVVALVRQFAMVEPGEPMFVLCRLEA